MNTVLRATAVLADPSAAWTHIATESDDAVYLLSGYVARLALVPALSSFIGACLIGVFVPGAGTVRAPVFDGLFGAIFGYVATFAEVLLVGLLIDLLAPRFGGRRGFAGALKLAVYSFTPVWLAGIFFLLPGLRFLGLTGFYGAYVLAKGLPRLMGSPERKSLAYAAFIVVFACLLTFIADGARRALFSTAGI
jgi:hypothetical protein